MNKTAKSSLARKIENRIISNIEPSNIDVYMIATMFLVHTLSSFPVTYGGLAKTILSKACSFASQVHQCDTYGEGPSIKGQEHEKRGDSHTIHRITGPSQRRPADFRSALQLSTFKTELLNFLAREWMSSDYASILEGHEVYFGMDQICFCYTAKQGKVHCRQIDKLKSSHKEADTKIIFHIHYVTQLDSESTKAVAVRRYDTDIFILLLYYASQISALMWMDAGKSSDNTRRFIDISALASDLTPSVCAALPSFHAFTGCDYTASFLRKGKTRPFDLFVTALSELGNSNTLDINVAAIIEEFVCAIYGVYNLNDVNLARYHIFRKLNAPSKNGQPLEKIKSYDPCCLPPCKAVLTQKLKHTNYIAMLWKNATISKPLSFGPDGYGWTIKDNKLQVVWFEGP